MTPTTAHARVTRLSPPTEALPSAMVRSSAAAWRSEYTTGSSTTSRSVASERDTFRKRHALLSAVYATR